ncbi:MAG: NADH-quinone oxidoreductase subunit H, partial [Candidatus Dadabacteria bacterium]
SLLSCIVTLVFLGGWNIPYVDLPPTWWGALIGHCVFLVKVVFLCILQIVIRWTLPRFRYDQLMRLGWKILLPFCMVNLLVTAAVKLLL